MNKFNRNVYASLFAGASAIGLAACDTGPRPLVFEAIPSSTVVAAPADGDTIAAAVKDAEAYARAQRLGALLPTLGPEAVSQVEETLSDGRLDLGSTEIELLVRFWATHQPAEASRWAVKRAPVNFRMGAVLTAVSVWAQQDPLAAKAAGDEWVADYRDIANVLQLGVVRGWFVNDPVALAEYIQGMETGFPRQRAVSAYLLTVVRTYGTDAMIEWAESVSEEDPGFKLTVYRQTTVTLAAFDHDAMLGWCDAHCEGPYGNNLRNIIGRRWAISDGAAALTWLSTAPEGDDEGHEKGLALRRAFTVWEQVDRDAAMAWMKEKTTGEPDPRFEAVHPVYAMELAKESPVDAIALAEGIQDERAREVGLIWVAQIWRTADEAAAEAWLLQSSLSEEARTKARSSGRRTPEPE